MSAPLWTFDALLAATRGRPVGVRPEVIGGISIDSRTIAPGEAFFAIRGENHDGHDFTTQALARGATTAVVAEEKLIRLGGIRGSLVVVSGVLEALAALGRAARARSDARIVAVTGSVGKTGTKEMLATALAADGPVHHSPSSFNNQWGVPLTLARMPQSSRYGVFEIGMNHAGEIEPLVKMVRPHAAIVTAVESVHLEYFKDVKAIARAKAEIFLGVEPGGSAIINRDNPHYALLARRARAAGVERIVGFGEHDKADVRLEKVVLKEDCSCISADVLGEKISYKLGAPGRHLVQNSLAVLAAVSVLGADLAKAALALAAVSPPDGRGRRFTLSYRDSRATLIDESYNANPASMRAVIAMLGQTVPRSRGRRIAVLGDMRELGPDGPAMHAELAPSLAEAGVDKAYLAGPLMKALWKALPRRMRGGYAETAAELESVILDEIGDGDVIMVKGSHASRMAPLVETIKARFAPADAAGDNTQERDIA